MLAVRADECRTLDRVAGHSYGGQIITALRPDAPNVVSR